ncbi:hypothetical protein Patl1_06501 [Pistacia atlantica]|uniref:Uncharacterized protein n=1 Tax=Pistacia atlantica TaxID=434234 RepID=A0ACC1BPK3_9ROSI|nr:hypothetical protein Patl1_06501 [Pistacia atlantica]
MENQRELQVQQRKGRRVMLFPLPLQGHLSPMLQLANILYNKGLSITIIHTNLNSPNPSNYPHFDLISFPDGFSEVEASTADGVAFVTRLNAVADSLKLPRIVLRTSNISSFLVFAAIPGLLREKDPQSEAPVPEFPPLRVKDLPPQSVAQYPDKFYQLFTLLASQTRASSGLIWNSCQELEQDAITALQQEFRIPIFTIGPFHKYFPAYSSSLLSQDQRCISWLDKQAPKSVIYVSFGSIVAINETEFLEIAWGLANSGVPFLWVVRPGSVHGAEWLEALPKGFLEMLDGRGHIVKWAPQQEVLAHPATGGFWTHNGWNSTLESICEGVPMICHPTFGDQPVIARNVSHIWRVGLHLEMRLEREEIARAIRRIILEAEGLEMRERIKCLKEQVDISLNGGSAYKSLESLITYIKSF